MPLSADLEPVLEHLAGRIRRGQLVVLVGAGASRWAGMPTWKAAIRELAKDLAPALREAVPDAARRFTPPSADEPISVDSFMKIAEAFRWVCGEERLHTRLRELFASGGLDVAALPLHRLLVRLSDHVPAIYTTNFDDLLERAFAAAGKRYQVVAEPRDLHAWRFDEVDGAFVPRFPIYKLHGSLDRPGTLVLGESDFQRRQGLTSHPIDLRFCSDVVGREVLLVGYSFSDPNVRWLWTKLRDLDVLPVAHFLELGVSSDLDVAYFLKDKIYPAPRADHSTQSAMKTFVSPGRLPFRFEAKTSRFPSGENMGNPSNVSFQVTRSRPVPSSFTRYRSKLRPLGSPTFDAKMIRRPSGWKNGAKLAAPRCVTCRWPEPSAFMTQISSCVGRTSPCARSARYASSSAPSRGRLARYTMRFPSAEKKAPPS
jgi:hypothetical protein